LVKLSAAAFAISFPDFGGAGECNLVDPRMRSKRGAGSFAVAGQDVYKLRQEKPAS